MSMLAGRRMLIGTDPNKKPQLATPCWMIEAGPAITAEPGEHIAVILLHQTEIERESLPDGVRDAQSELQSRDICAAVYTDENGAAAMCLKDAGHKEAE